METTHILILESESSDRQELSKICSSLGFAVQAEANIIKGLNSLAIQPCHLAFLSMKRGEISQNVLFDSIKKYPHVGFVFVSEQSHMQEFADWMRTGVCDYITKPIHRKEVEIITSRMLSRLSQRRMNGSFFVKEKDPKYDFSDIIGVSSSIQDLFEIIKKIADAKSTILLTGETGTGKELFAQAIHKNSSRRTKPLVTVNCGAIPTGLMESEFFGHVKGAFTHATETKMGLFEKAHGGTIFLDEIGELPLELQVKILRAIQEEEVKRVGNSISTKVDVRIIAATNKDLEEAVHQGRFREDLFFRLNVVHLHIPPLRNRKEDIAVLAAYFLKKYADHNRRIVNDISANAMAMLKNYHWPGNVRELENAIERTVLLLDRHKETIQERDLPEFLEKRRFEVRERFRQEALDKKLSIEEYTRSFVEKFQDELNEKELACYLGITPKTLWEKRQKWDMPRRGVRKNRMSTDEEVPDEHEGNSGQKAMGY